MKNLYEILQVSQNASQDIIEKVYRYLAKKYHPDLHPEDREHALNRMVEINKAYEILGDESKRQTYDNMLKYETHKVNYNNYSRKNKMAVSLNGLEKSIAKGIFFLSFGVIVAAIVYLSMNKPIKVDVSNKDSEVQQIYLSELNEARSDGLWKSGVTKERVSKVLGKNYYNNLTQQIKLSVLSSRMFKSSNIKNYCSSDYILAKNFRLFKGFVGIDDTTKNSELSGVVLVYGDDKELYRSENIYGGYKPHKFEIDVKNIDRISLRLEAHLPEKELGWSFRDNIKVGIYNCLLIKK